MRHGYFHEGHGSGVVHVLAWLFPLLVIGALVALVVVLLTRGDHHLGGMRHAVADDGAHAALRLRYARGEIGRDEYYEAMRDLTQPVGGWTPPPTPPATPPATPATPPAAPPAPPTQPMPPTPPAAPGPEEHPGA